MNKYLLSITIFVCTILICSTAYYIAKPDQYYYYYSDGFIHKVDKDTGVIYKAKHPYGWLEIK